MNIYIEITIIMLIQVIYLVNVNDEAKCRSMRQAFSADEIIYYSKVAFSVIQYYITQFTT